MAADVEEILEIVAEVCDTGEVERAELVMSHLVAVVGESSDDAQAAADCGGVPVLARLLHARLATAPGDDELFSSALLVLATMTTLPDVGDEFVEAGLIELAVEMLEEGALGDPNVQMAASMVSNLSAEPTTAAAAFIGAGAVGGLAGVLQRWAAAPAAQREAARLTAQWAAAALSNLCQQPGPDALAALVDSGGVQAVNDALAHAGGGDGTIEQFLCGCLCSVAVVDPEALVASGGIETALTVVRSKSPSRTRQAAVAVISNLQGDGNPDVDQELRQAGAVESLRLCGQSRSSKALQSSVEEALAGLEQDGESTADDDGSPRPGSRSGKPKKRRKKPAKRPSTPAKDVRETRKGKVRTRPRGPEPHTDEAAQEQKEHPAVKHGGREDDNAPSMTDKASQDGTSRDETSRWLQREASREAAYPQPAAAAQRPTSPSFSTSVELAAAQDLLRSKRWSEQAIQALMARPEKMLAICATLRTSSPPRPGSPQRPGSPGSWRQAHTDGRSPSPPQTAPASVHQSQQPLRLPFSMPTPSDLSTFGHPGRPATAAASLSAFGRSSRMTSLPLWAVDIFNLFMPAGLAPRGIIYRCFGEAFARAEDLLDVCVLEKYSVAVLVFSYSDEAKASNAHMQLQAEPLVARGRPWPLRLVREGRTIKTYVPQRGATDGPSVASVQDAFGSCAEAYDELKVLRETDESADKDGTADLKFHAGHIRCFYRNQTDLAEFCFCCSNAGFATRSVGLVERRSEWDQSTRRAPSPDGRANTLGW